MKKYIKFLIPGILFILIAGFVIMNYLSNRIPVNPSEATGNTPGNLSNGGLFCEYNGSVYFSNPYDKGRLYRMNPDCSDITYLSNDTVSYLNAYGSYLFYVKNNSDTSDNVSTVFRSELYGIVRMNLDTYKTATLRTEYTDDMALAGNTLVFDGNRNGQKVTYTTNLEGKDDTILFQGDIPNTSVYDSSIYYSNNTDNHSIYALSIETGLPRLFYDGNTIMTNLIEDDLYYIDLDLNRSLVRINTNTLEKEILIDENCYLYNIYDTFVYYYMKSNSFNGLYRLNLKDKTTEKVVTGTITSISCTSQYTFFQMNDQTDLYRIPTNSSLAVQSFSIQSAQ